MAVLIPGTGRAKDIFARELQVNTIFLVWGEHMRSLELGELLWGAATIMMLRCCLFQCRGSTELRRACLFMLGI